LGTGFAWCRADGRAREWMDGYGNTYTDYAKYDRAAVSELLRARVEQAIIFFDMPSLINAK